MPQVTWSSTRSALVAALALPAVLPGLAARAVGEALLAELDAVGAAYDAAWTTHGATLTARETAYASALSTWTGDLASLWDDATDVAAYLEHKVYLGRAGLTPTPRVLETAAGSLALTEHADALPSPWADPSPAVVAARTLDASGSVPALRLEALASGVAGNSVTVTVAAATSGRASECKLTVTRGSGVTAPYVEVWDNLDLTRDDARAPDVGSSLLLRSATLLTTARPVNVGPVALTGGAGEVLDAMDVRLARLVAAAASGEVALVETDRLTAEALRERLTSHWSALPSLDNPIAEAEQKLVAAKARAAAHTALLAGVYT